MHTLRNNKPASQTVRAGSLHWTIYAWLISAKYCIIYFQKELTQAIWLTPIFYCILAFKALRHFFFLNNQRRCASSSSSYKMQQFRNHQERIALDVSLLQDMVWHVV